MMFQAVVDGRLVQAHASGARGTCPLCKNSVVARCGDVVAPHWAHLVGKDCDRWYQMSEWHRAWQALVPAERREVVIGAHRADVVTPDGMVVEFQRGGLKSTDVIARETHYGRGMWVVDMTSRTSPPSWIRHAKWPVLYDHGATGVRYGGREIRDHLVVRLNADVPAVRATLDWNDRRHTLRSAAPCRVCRMPSYLADDDGAPCHKVCAERYIELGMSL